MQERPTTDLESSLLRSPKASEGSGGALGEAEALKRGNTVGVRDQIMDLVASQGLKVSREADNLLPTPNTMEHREIKTPEEIAELKERSPGGYRNLREVVINELPENDFLDDFDDSEIRLLGTPRTSSANGSTSKEVENGAPKARLEDQVQLLPTPAVGHIRNYDEPIEDYLDRRSKFESGEYRGMPGISLGVAVRMEMLPTPVASEGLKAPAQQDAETKGKTGQVWLSNVAKTISNDNAEMTLFPTLRASDGYERRNQRTMDKIAAEGGDLTMPTLARTTIDWGKFTAAIERWEAITRPAPAPTKPDGKDGNHRLSAEFTEWMMGLPEGWVTSPEIGLKRNDQLKACGNGVVPQQAELALRILLQDIELEGK